MARVTSPPLLSKWNDRKPVDKSTINADIRENMEFAIEKQEKPKPEVPSEPKAITTLKSIIAGNHDNDPESIDRLLDEAAEELEEAGRMDEFDAILNQAADHYTDVLEKLVKEAA